MSPAVQQGRSVKACLSRSQRLTSNASIRAAYSQGRRWVGRAMVLWIGSGEGAALRLAVVSSRKVGGAVQRNRARRRLREAFRLNRHLMHAEVDVVLVARKSINTISFDDVQSELLSLAQRAGLIDKGAR